MFIEITDRPITPERTMDVSSSVRRDAHGAVVTFNGVIRDHSEGRKVISMEYEAFREMAEKKLRELLEEIKVRWGIEDVAIVHRVGKLEIGETAVVIAVAASHRKTAFEACQYAIDRLKQIVPIWKKEVFEGGEGWV
ncbi:MAG: MoaD family protein [Dehalococcoidia bacterium]|nr:MoaD family protein [Dehalococcoidia bacterium]